jgi:DNA repair protein RadD
MLRRYQIDATNAAIRALKEGQNPVICAATGTGKSLIIASLIERLTKANDIRIMVATHVAELLVQNAGKLRAAMPDADIGIYSAGLNQKDTGNKILFAGIQSIFRAKDIGTFHVLIVDEAHTIGRKDASMWGKLVETLKAAYPKLKIIGLSATPFRMDSGSLTSGDGALFDTIVFDYGLGRAVQDGYLAPLKGKHTKTEYNIDGVGKVAGEFNLKELEAATNIDALTAKAVQEVIDYGHNRRSWLFFCNGVAHSFAVRDELMRRGIVAETVTGETPDNERSRILEEFKAGRIKAVTNNAVWTTGVDVPHVDLIAMLRHTMSGGLLLQMAGRGTRVTIDLSGYNSAQDRRAAIAASDKPDCLFLDFAGNIRRHGFLDQIKAKEKGAKGEGVAPMKHCPECFSICHAAATNCKDCGYEFPKNEVQALEGAHAGAVMGGEPEIRDVIAIEYLPHNLDKAGKTPCLRVKYTHPDAYTSEYICLQHEGFAKQKAMKWWNVRGGGDFGDLGISSIVGLGYCDTLKRPSKITVKKDGKYDRIIAYDFSLPEGGDDDKTDEASTLADIEDIEF